MRADAELHFFGEDVLDPYGGAFKVVRGLSTAFPDRVHTTPISESGIVGVATGMALRGRSAIVEIMFGDFLGLAMDQILNHAAKMRWMYNDQIEIPLIVRTPMGGRRGYGPTHSQSIEKHFCGIPDLIVLAVDQYTSIEELYLKAHASRQPTLIIENKVLYARMVEDAETLPNAADPEVVLIAYGGSVEIAVVAARQLAEEEVRASVVPIRQLSPLPADELRAAVGNCRCVLTIEEGAPGWGFADACARALIGMPIQFASLSGPNHPLPSSRAWEERVLPSPDLVVETVVQLLGLGQPAEDRR